MKQVEYDVSSDNDKEIFVYENHHEEPCFDMVVMLANVRADHPFEGENSKDENKELRQPTQHTKF